MIQTCEVSITSQVFSKDTTYQEADAIERLVKPLAAANAHLLFISRQTPVGLAGEYLYPEAQFIATFDDAMLHAQLDGVPSNRRSAIVFIIMPFRIPLASPVVVSSWCFRCVFMAFSYIDGRGEGTLKGIVMMVNLVSVG